MARRRAYPDDLTGLPSHRQLTQVLRTMVADKSVSTITVIFADIDDFKQVNSDFSHENGNRLIQLFATAFAKAVREVGGPRAFVARKGGDEFVALLPNVKAEAASITVAEIGSRVAKQYTFADRRVALAGKISIEVSSSLGAYFAANPREECLRLSEQESNQHMVFVDAAGQAMFDAKKTKGVGRFSFVLSDEQRYLKHREGKVQSELLRRSILNGDHTNCYMPIIELSTMSLHSVEVLIEPGGGRFTRRDKERDLALIEEWGLIQLIWQRALAMACQELRIHPGVGFAINISPVEFLDPDMPVTARKIVDQHGVDPSQVTFELTERLPLDQEDDFYVEFQITSFAKQGFRIVMDDFGAGQSNIDRLVRYRGFSGIKLDKYLVRQLRFDARAAHICQAIIDLAHNIGMTVTAEGIEHASQLETLRDLGCDFGQGFLLGRSVPSADVHELSASYGIQP